MGTQKMTIGITGATGFVGSRLTEWLAEVGYAVVPLGRTVTDDPARLAEQVAQCDAIINLAGAPITKRWSARYRHELRASRIDLTHRVVAAIGANTRTRLLISTSAVGIYPAEGCHDESQERLSTSFLGALCADWEAAARQVRSGVRCVITRFGVVFAPTGGAFERLVAPYKRGVALRLGDRADRIAWIDREDLVRAMQFLIENDSAAGVFNLTAEPCSWGDFDRIVSAHYRIHLRFRLPALLLRGVLGERSSLFTQNACVLPARLLAAGFCFKTPRFDRFLWGL